MKFIYVLRNFLFLIYVLVNFKYNKYHNKFTYIILSLTIFFNLNIINYLNKFTYNNFNFKIILNILKFYCVK